MLENFLTDELPLAIAIGGEPDLLCGAQRVTDGFELGGFVAAFSRAGAIKAFGTKQDRRPALPGRHDILRLQKVQQMSLSRKDVSVARAHGGAHVFCLASFLGDDDLIRHAGLVRGTLVGARTREERIENTIESQVTSGASNSRESRSIVSNIPDRHSRGQART